MHRAVAKKKFLHWKWAKKKILAGKKSPIPPITFLMVRPLTPDNQGMSNFQPLGYLFH